MTGRDFVAARRVNNALTAAVEKRALVWLAARAPAWVTSDGLTAMGLLAQVGAGLGYALARWDRRLLWVVIACVALNWLGDSLDGTVARVRRQQRPRYGFYVDHLVDMLGAVALMTGMACSGLVHWQVALAMLLAFLLLAGESFLATCTLGCFQLSQGLFGPTEIRILMIAGNLTLLHSTTVTVLGRRMLLFDLGGGIAALCMFGMLAVVAARHTAELYRAEPLAVREPLGVKEPQL